MSEQIVLNPSALVSYFSTFDYFWFVFNRGLESVQQFEMTEEDFRQAQTQHLARFAVGKMDNIKCKAW